MLLHHPPTHVAYPVKRFIFADSRQAALIGFALLMGISTSNRIHKLTVTPPPPPITIEDGRQIELPWANTSPIPEPLREWGPLAAGSATGLAITSLGYLNLRARLRRWLRWRALPARTTYRPEGTPHGTEAS